MATALPRLLSVPDVADWLSLSSRQVLALVRKNSIPHIVLPGDELVFDSDELVRWLETLRAQRRPEGGEDVE
jgi:hypothetical protein